MEIKIGPKKISAPPPCYSPAKKLDKKISFPEYYSPAKKLDQKLSSPKYYGLAFLRPTLDSNFGRFWDARGPSILMVNMGNNYTHYQFMCGIICWFYGSSRLPNYFIKCKC